MIAAIVVADHAPDPVDELVAVAVQAAGTLLAVIVLVWVAVAYLDARAAARRALPPIVEPRHSAVRVIGPRR